MNCLKCNAQAVCWPLHVVRIDCIVFQRYTVCQSNHSGCKLGLRKNCGKVHLGKDHAKHVRVEHRFFFRTSLNKFRWRKSYDPPWLFDKHMQTVASRASSSYLLYRRYMAIKHTSPQDYILFLRPDSAHALQIDAKDMLRERSANKSPKKCWCVQCIPLDDLNSHPHVCVSIKCVLQKNVPD